MSIHVTICLEVEGYDSDNPCASTRRRTSAASIRTASCDAISGQSAVSFEECALVVEPPKATPKARISSTPIWGFHSIPKQTASHEYHNLLYPAAARKSQLN